MRQSSSSHGRRGAEVARTRRVLLTLLIVGLAATAAGVGTYSAFSSTSSNPNDALAAGTVYLSDNDSGAVLLSLAGAKPGNSSTGCIKVTYTGSLDSTVRLYSTVAGGLAPYLTVTIIRGTDSSPSFPTCTNFTADPTNYIGSGPGVIFSDVLSNLPGSYGAGLVDPTAGAPATWSTNATHSYKFVISLNNNAAAQGLSATANIVWEARNL